MKFDDQPLYEISKLSAAYNKKNFGCGSVALDNYLKTQAGQDIRKNVSVSYVLTLFKSVHVIGYYTLTSISIDASDLCDEFIKKLPKYPLLPGILIGRLAVDMNYQAKKLGAHLIIDALKRCLFISEQIGINVIVVDAKDMKAVSFYRHYGFIEFPSNKMKLFLPMGTIKKIF